MPVKTIKDVDEETWRKLKMLSAEEDVRIGRLIENITDSYIKNKNDVWEKILNPGKILSDSEAKEMKIVVKRMRKERGFR